MDAADSIGRVAAASGLTIPSGQREDSAGTKHNPLLVTETAAEVVDKRGKVIATGWAALRQIERTGNYSNIGTKIS